MAATASIGYGLTIGYSAYPTPSTYTNVGQVMNVKGPGLKTKDVNVTSNDSSQAQDEFIPGLTDPGAVTFEVVYSTAIATALLALNRTMKTWKITYADTHTIIFAGFINDIAFDAPLDDKVT